MAELFYPLLFFMWLAHHNNEWNKGKVIHYEENRSAIPYPNKFISL